MAEDFKGVPYRDDGTTSNYTMPDWSTVDPSSLSFTRQPAAVQKPEHTGSETYRPIGQQQGTVNDHEQQADQQSQNRNPDFYNNQKIINLNSSRYRGLGKRRRLRNDLRALGQDAVVWNGANMQMASNFSGGQQFNRRNAMDMIRNGRQNAGMYSDNNFKAGTIEADANRRVHEYFSEHQNASRANWDHGNWQKPTETPISQSFQNMLQQYQGGYTPGAMTAYAQKLQPTWKQQTANTQVNAQPASQSNASRRKSAWTPSYNWQGNDLTTWQGLVGTDADGKFGNETMRKFNGIFGQGWSQRILGDGTSEITAKDGTKYYNTGRYLDKNGNMGWWRTDGSMQADAKPYPQITISNFWANVGKQVAQPIIDEGQRYHAKGSISSMKLHRLYSTKFRDAFIKQFGKDKLDTEEYNNALQRNYNQFYKNYNITNSGRDAIFN